MPVDFSTSFPSSSPSDPGTGPIGAFSSASVCSPQAVSMSRCPQQQRLTRPRGHRTRDNQGTPRRKGWGVGSVSGQPHLHGVDPLGPVGEVLVDFRGVVQHRVAAAATADRVAVGSPVQPVVVSRVFGVGLAVVALQDVVADQAKDRGSDLISTVNSLGSLFLLGAAT